MIDNTPIRILLVDDHPIVQEGLRRVLEMESDLEIVGEAGTVNHAVVLARRLRPNVVLLDVVLLDGSGIEVCREIRENEPAIRVLMLTSFGEETAVLAAMMAGASGYLLKLVGPRDLVTAIHAVAGGATILDPTVASVMQQRLTNLAAPGHGEQSMLSKREREVIALVAEGLTNREIAHRLKIEEKTARNHVSNILDKLGLARRSQVAAYAVRHGFAREE